MSGEEVIHNLSGKTVTATSVADGWLTICTKAGELFVSGWSGQELDVHWTPAARDKTSKRPRAAKGPANKTSVTRRIGAWGGP